MAIKFRSSFLVSALLGIPGVFAYSHFADPDVLSSLQVNKSIVSESSAATDNLESSSVANIKNKQIISYIEPIYAADFSDDRILVGASHNIFIGTVLTQTGTKERGIGPETQFMVEVVENIKGDLKGQVVVDQQGGYKNGALYIVQDDSADTRKEGESHLLTPGSTYLFATRYNQEEGWYTLNSHPAASKLLNNDAALGLAKLAKLASEDSRVRALKEAYPNEILIKADVVNHNTRNSYVQKDQSQVAPSFQENDALHE